MKRPPPWHWLAPLLFAAGLYAVTIPGTYTYDDVLVAKQDPRLHDPRAWFEFWREGYYQDAVDNPWRPVVSMTIAIQAWAHPNHAWPFHLVNVLLHAVASALVAGLGARLVDRRVGLIAGLLFAAHPVHVEAVAGIVGRAEAMATIGILAALLTLIDRPLSTGRAVAVTAWFLFAALCKEQGILVPVMVLAWIVLAKRDAADVRPADDSLAASADGVLPYASPRPRAARNPAAALLAALLMGALAAYVSYRNSVAPWFWERGFLDPAINPVVKSTGPDRWLVPVSIVGRYVTLLVAPYRLSIDYSASVFTTKVHWHEPYVYLGIVSIVAGTLWLFTSWRRGWRAVTLCLVCFGLVGFMVSNLLLIGTVFAERLMYVPSAFACVVIAIGLARLSRRQLTVAMVLILAAFSWRTSSYAWQWNDAYRLYRYAYATQPRAANVHRLLAQAEMERGNLDEAERIFTHARDVAPQSWSVWAESARLAIKRGRLEDAVQFARRAMKTHPSGSTAALWTDVEDAVSKATTQPATTRGAPDKP